MAVTTPKRCANFVSVTTNMCTTPELFEREGGSVRKNYMFYESVYIYIMILSILIIIM